MDYKWYDILLIGIFISLLGILSKDFVVLVGFIFTIVYLFITERKHLLNYLALSSLVALIWMVFANDIYGYNESTFRIFTLNSFPLLGWALSLFAIYMLYDSFFSKDSYLKGLLHYSMIFIPLLIFTETISYHYFNIHNLATSSYPGLPLCDCIHAPVWMQSVYLLLGPIYYSMAYLLRKKLK